MLNPNGIGNQLMAIKWIGNDGSHYKKITKEDILDAFKILEYCLNKIYVKEEEEIKKLAKKINTIKGTRSK